MAVAGPSAPRAGATGAEARVGRPEPAFLLEARGITKSFGPTRVLRGVDFAVAAGEIHALLGGNGAGKSTLLKIVSGTETRDGGSLLYKGHDVDHHEGREARSGGIAVVHQELALLPHLTVAENIDLPHHRRGASLFSQRAAHRIALDALVADRPRTSPRRAVGRQVGDLTLHEQQLVEIARALNSGAQLLLLDEPTANLTAAETERLFDVLRGLVARDPHLRRVRLAPDAGDPPDRRRLHHHPRRRRRRSTARRSAPSRDAEIVEQMGQASALAGAAEASPASRRGPTSRQATGGAPGDQGAWCRRRRSRAAASSAWPARPPVPEALIDALIGAAPGADLRILLDGREQVIRSPREAARSRVGFVSRRPREQGRARHAAHHRQHDGVAPGRASPEAGPAARKSAEAGRLLAALRIKARSAVGPAGHAERWHAAEAADRPLARPQPGHAGAGGADARRRHRHQAGNLRPDPPDGGGRARRWSGGRPSRSSCRAVRRRPRLRSRTGARPASCAAPRSTRNGSPPATGMAA